MSGLVSETDFIVIGAGVAGLRAAIALAEAGRVLVLAKQHLTDSATQYAQGGVAVALSDEDEISLHLQDTLDAGDGLVDLAAAQVLVGEGPDRIQELVDWGTQFDRSGLKLTFTREGAHSRSRILHAHGDSTGREMARALYAKTSTLPNISLKEFQFTADLVIDDGRACGVELLSDSGERQRVLASAVLLATGGAGQVYRDTTNPEVATGDGIAMAFRANAEISDMEFVQFHPTALYAKDAPRFLLSEALRGEGAYLINSSGERFMVGQHPLAELAPRDVVSRALVDEMNLSKEREPVVYLDMRHLKIDVAKRFPRIYETCLRFNVNIVKDLVPVRPAAHYLMGGVRTDLWGQTSIPSLYAAGETACTGVHGANRLASNSLLEGVVFGARAGEKMRDKLVTSERSQLRFAQEKRPTTTETLERSDQSIHTIQNIMWRHVGVVRSAEGLQEAISMTGAVKERMGLPTTSRSCEANNIAQIAELIARSALAREESRGAHYRTDFPALNDKEYRKHSVVKAGEITFA